MARLVHAVIALFILTMGVIQFNDPDPAYWVTVYVLVAVVPAARVFGRRLPKTSLVAAGMVLSGMMIAAPGFIDYLTSGDYASIGGEMMLAKPYVEAAREFIGLAIAAVALSVYNKWGLR